MAAKKNEALIHSLNLIFFSFIFFLLSITHVIYVDDWERKKKKRKSKIEGDVNEGIDSTSFPDSDSSTKRRVCSVNSKRSN